MKAARIETLGLPRGRNLVARAVRKVLKRRCAGDRTAQEFYAVLIRRGLRRRPREKPARGISVTHLQRSQARAGRKMMRPTDLQKTQVIRFRFAREAIR